MTSSIPIRAIAATLFFVSGALGLGYELVWIRKAALVVGASQIALSTVLTSFFLGLGLGGLVVGRRPRATRRSPLVVYGLFEIGIGAYALLFPELFAVLESIYGLAYPAAAASGATLFALRFALLLALCLPPTFLMGGTLPLLLDGLVGEDRRIGSSTSLLYGLNVLGAVAGVLATTYGAIPALGMDGTSRVAGFGNLAIGAVALALFRRARPLHAADGPVPGPARVYLALAFTTGAVSIAWQVCHARFFSLLDVTTVHATAMLLALWLLGLAVGSLLLAPLLAGRVEPLRAVAAAQFLVPAAGLLALRAAGLVDFSFALGAQRTADGQVVPLETMQVLPHAAFWSETLDAVFFAPLVQIGLVVLAPVMLMGICLPGLIASATRHSASLRSVAGTLVFWNTVGSSAGAAATGYVLLPLIGLHRTLGLLGTASLATGWIAFRTARGAPRAGSRIALGVAPVLGAATLAHFAFLTDDVTRHAIEHLGYGKDSSGGELAEIVEGAVGTVYVYDGPSHLLLASGGVAYASASKNGPSPQAIQGHLPALFFPGRGAPRRCLGIGIGSGQSFGALLMYDIESLDVVDIFPELVDLSLRRFAPYNHALATDPRVRLHFDDGRHFVARAPDDSYDVISMEPPPPRADGVYSLYSIEFYREVRRCLTDRGVFMQWLPLYRVTPLDARGILRTQTAIFPETFVLKQADEDFMIVSFKSRPTFEVEEILRRIDVFSAERLLAGRKWSPGCEHPIASFEGVVAMILAGPNALATIDGPGPFGEDRMELSYGGGDRWLLERYRSAVSRISFAAVPQSALAQVAGYFEPDLPAERLAPLERERAAALEFYNVVDPARVARWRAMAEEGTDLRERVRGNLALAAAHDVRLQKHEALDRLRTAIESDPGNAAAEDVALARRIVLNHFAVYHEEITGFVETMRVRFAQAPLVVAMVAAYDLAERLEQERRARYLFPER